MINLTSIKEYQKQKRDKRESERSITQKANKMNNKDAYATSRNDLESSSKERIKCLTFPVHGIIRYKNNTKQLAYFKNKKILEETLIGYTIEGIDIYKITKQGKKKMIIYDI